LATSKSAADSTKFPQSIAFNEPFGYGRRAPHKWRGAAFVN
jgi:hypothetical protein